jgi:3-phenylpropionate/trans-cinnamate dioxygenase alpha subunit
MEQWGLVPVAQVESYHGMIFGCFDAEAPNLREYLGDIAFYMDLYLDRREGQTELLGGVHKWMMHCNWKFAADNFAGDGYHIATSHISAIKSGLFGSGGVVQRNVPEGEAPPLRYGVYAGQGHATNIFPGNGGLRGGRLADYLSTIQDEKNRRLGPERIPLSTGVITVFPNLSFHGSPSIRVWHPCGPDKTEVWSWCIVDKDAPPDVKEEMRTNYLRTFSMAGVAEQDDGENWNQCTASSKGVISRRYPFNYAMGMRYETSNEDYPGVLGPHITEVNQRGFYAHWSKVMNAESWADIKNTPDAVLR